MGPRSRPDVFGPMWRVGSTFARTAQRTKILQALLVLAGIVIAGLWSLQIGGALGAPLMRLSRLGTFALTTKPPRRRRPTKRRVAPQVLGWREWVTFCDVPAGSGEVFPADRDPGAAERDVLPGATVADKFISADDVSSPVAKVRIKAKVDTGARTSTLHAFGLERFDKDGIDTVRFAIHPLQRSAAGSVTVEYPVIDDRMVRSSSGRAQRRPVVSMPIEIAGRKLDIELTLTRRDEMGFRMLLGREALRKRFIVDPSRSFLADKKPS